MTEPLRLIVHPGIGDLSWVYSKFAHYHRPLEIYVAADIRQRSKPFLDLLPNVSSSSYSNNMSDYEWLHSCWNASIKDIEGAEARGQKLYISCNNWVDNGNRLEEWIPDLPTDFNYDLPLPQEAVEKVSGLLPPGAMYVCIHMASADAIGLWKSWNAIEWFEFMQHIHTSYPFVVFAIIGASWDVELAKSLARLLKTDRSLNYVNLTGTLKLAESLAVVRQCRYMAGFASGMSILANVMNIPTLMLYPQHLTSLMYSWPSPQSIALRTYEGIVWCRPGDAFRRVATTIHQALG